MMRKVELILGLTIPILVEIIGAVICACLSDGNKEEVIWDILS
jgi:hypothetical protein